MERWTIREPVTGNYGAHHLVSGPYPGSFGEFAYAASLDPTVETVEVTHAAEADARTRECTPSLRKGVERCWDSHFEAGELVTSLRIEILRVDRHPPDYELRGSTHGSILLLNLIQKHGVRGPDVKAWLTSTVRALAGSIRRDAAFDRLPILADALMDAGCDNADVLDHCRGNSPHVRGCWVVDLVLGKS